ncbi:hypothetical protein ABIB25_000438 [Nakamurella sp. UYEF19]|uniref:DUF4192 domain-containing protein n=1 Tax=Nakamurella sp. UYEF19 TaxID=1756392 RepID=UPI003397BD6F
MTTTDGTTTTVRLSGRSGLLAAIPAMLGFHPQESLVMVCMSGPRRRLGPVIRMDLEEPRGQGGPPSPPGEQLRLYAGRYSDEVALVCYSRAKRRPGLYDKVVESLEAGGTTILDQVFVRGDRVCSSWPGRGDNSGRLPGARDPQVLAMNAASALSGRSILVDRQALRDSIAGPVGRAATQASRALHLAADALVGPVGTEGPVDSAALEEMTRVNIDRALAEAAGSSGLPASRCALIALLLSDVQIRDHVIARAVEEMEPPWLPMLIAVARATPDVDAAPICAVLSVAAYRRGDGALAQVALDRVLKAEPDYRLAHLMLGVMAAGLPPSNLRGLGQDPPSVQDVLSAQEGGLPWPDSTPGRTGASGQERTDDLGGGNDLDQ